MENRRKKRGFRGSMLFMLIMFVFAFIKLAAGGAITFTCSRNPLIMVLLSGGLLQFIVAFFLPIGFCFCWEKHRILVHTFVVVIVLLTATYITAGCVISSQSRDLLRSKNKTTKSSLTFNHTNKTKNETTFTAKYNVTYDTKQTNSLEEEDVLQSWLDGSSMLENEGSRINSSVQNEENRQNCRMLLLKFTNVIFPLDVILAAAACTLYIYVSIRSRKLRPKVNNDSGACINDADQSQDFRWRG
ncbi:hypothetical protein CHS0354_024289 [Potamilus streckersoni]|uniref:Uncharacterized protein n=1 Tax=Potamilus streckersoni TaxID=2493646 RepID=A0AAE0RNL3_9BIVA|nr:hypothetical protein CHS0354_024289 [Potamilus streckersoni]